MQRFEEEGMLYLVPQGADDDWYWIYSTVAENRKNIAYVVRILEIYVPCNAANKIK